MKHEYTADELAELKSIYDESGEAGLQIGEMRALRKAGLLTQGLPAKPEAPSKRDLIIAHCKNRIDQGQPFDGKETAEALGMSQKTVGNIISQLRKEDYCRPLTSTRHAAKHRKPPQPERRRRPSWPSHRNQPPARRNQ